MKYSLGTPIGDILKSEAAVNAIEEIVPGIIKNPMLRGFASQSIQSLVNQFPGYISEEALKKVGEALEAIEE